MKRYKIQHYHCFAKSWQDLLVEGIFVHFSRNKMTRKMYKWVSQPEVIFGHWRLLEIDDKKGIVKVVEKLERQRVEEVIEWRD